MARIEKLTEDINSLKNENITLKMELQSYKSNTRNNAFTVNSPTSVDIVRELKDRELKSHNFIMFDVNESVIDVKALAYNLIKRLKINTVISSATRIGKQLDNKTRPIKVSLNSSEAVISIMKSKKSVSNDPEWGKNLDN